MKAVLNLLPFLAQLHYHGGLLHHHPPQPVMLGDVCSILNKEDNGGETSEISMCSKSLVHTYILVLCIFPPANLKSQVEHLKKKILNMQENQDEIFQSLKSLERSLTRLVPTMTVVTPLAIEMNNPLIATNPQETAAPPHSSPSPSATPQPASPTTPSSTLLPITIASRSNSLPSSAIDRSGLCTIEEVLLKYPKILV